MPSAPGIIQVQVRLPQELWERVKAAAVAEDRSANQVAVRALEAAFPAPQKKHGTRK